MNRISFIIGFVFLLSYALFGQTAGKNVKSENGTHFCITQDELILYNLINDLRRQNKLSVIPLSKSLCQVSKAHIIDLLTYHPQDQECGFHSWSSHGNWKACCYNSDPMGNKCMLSKPSEITSYTGPGYELLYWDEKTASPYDAYDLWKQLSASREMLLNKGKWKSKSWRALGMGINNGYAIIWLGDEKDLAADIYICENDSLIQKQTNDVKSAHKSESNANPKKEVITEKTQKVRNGNVSDTGSKPVKEPVKELIKETAKEPVKSPVKEDAKKEDAKVTTDQPDQKNHYYIIVASLKTSELAEIRKKELVDEGYKNIILLPSNERYRLSVGSYPTEASCKKKLNELRDKFPDCWILKQ